MNQDIQNCNVANCYEPADGIEGACLKCSKGKPGYENLKLERAELCKCGTHLGYWTPLGFNLVHPNMDTLATVDPGSEMTVVCRSCQHETSVIVLAGRLPPLPLKPSATS